MKRRLALLAAVILTTCVCLAGSTARPATAAAEWCDTDPVIPHVTIGGQHYTLHIVVSVAVADRQAAHQATATATALPDGRVLVEVVGPPVPWRVRGYSAPSGYAGGTGDVIHAPGERVVFYLTEVGR